MLKLSTAQKEKGHLYLSTNYEYKFDICIEIDHEFITFFRILSRYFVENTVAYTKTFQVITPLPFHVSFI